MGKVNEEWLNKNTTQGGFHVGQKVMWKNHSGILRGPFHIVGFCDPPKKGYGGTVFLDWDCYWFPVEEKDLRACIR